VVTDALTAHANSIGGIYVRPHAVSTEGSRRYRSDPRMAAGRPVATVGDRLDLAEQIAYARNMPMQTSSPNCIGRPVDEHNAVVTTSYHPSERHSERMSSALTPARSAQRARVRSQAERA
jgi:hypothetical protein